MMAAAAVVQSAGVVTSELPAREPWPRETHIQSGGRQAAAEDGVDVSRPLVAQVGDLGERYLEWVHRPVSGCPVFFDGPLEMLTKTPWYAVPVVWLPLMGWALWRCAAIAGMPAADIASLFIMGMVLWQGLEYAIHRCVFHATPSGPWGITLHFLFHGCHHKFPMDGLRLVFPPVPAGIVIGAIYVALRAALPAHVDLAVGAGALFGYVCYDMLHYSFHHSPLVPSRLLRYLKSKHLAHHYKDPNRGFHISGDAMDLLFGTL
eukprot:evm.model.scf_860.5 EVM.evm.TU.scf_860.5   scf_860:36099-36884(+)